MYISKHVEDAKKNRDLDNYSNRPNTVRGVKKTECTQSPR